MEDLETMWFISCANHPPRIRSYRKNGNRTIKIAGELANINKVKGRVNYTRWWWRVRKIVCGGLAGVACIGGLTSIRVAVNPGGDWITTYFWYQLDYQKKIDWMLKENGSSALYLFLSSLGIYNQNQLHKNSNWTRNNNRNQEIK